MKIHQELIKETWGAYGKELRYPVYFAHNPNTDETQETTFIYDQMYFYKEVVTKDSNDEWVNKAKILFNDLKKEDLFYAEAQEFVKTILNKGGKDE